MTDLEKQKVAVLRSQGQSYGAIADALHVSVNSVKTFCRRSHLSGSKPAESLPENNLTESENRVIGHERGFSQSGMKLVHSVVLCSCGIRSIYIWVFELVSDRGWMCFGAQ